MKWDIVNNTNLKQIFIDVKGKKSEFDNFLEYYKSTYTCIKCDSVRWKYSQDDNEYLYINHYFVCLVCNEKLCLKYEKNEIIFRIDFQIPLFLRSKPIIK